MSGFLAKIGLPFGVEISLEKRMPLSSGLGSSAASAVAAVFAANLLAGSPLSARELLPFTMEAEKAACGSAHADNVAPSLLGGFVLIRSYDPLDVVQLPVPAGLSCAVVHPHTELRTEDARRDSQEGDPACRTPSASGETSRPWWRRCTTGTSAPGPVAAGRGGRARTVPAHPRVRRGEGGGAGRGRAGLLHLGVRPVGLRPVRDHRGLRAAGEAMVAAFQAAGLASDLYLSAVNTKGPVVIDPQGRRGGSAS